MDSAMQHILRLSLLELLRLTGFTGTSPSALNLLVDVLERYLSHLALASSATAELSCRSIVNVDDVALALKKDDVTVEELARQLDLVDEVELSFMPPPAFPLAKSSLPAPSSPPASSLLSDPSSFTTKSSFPPSTSSSSSTAPPPPLPLRLEGLKLRIGREAGGPLAKASSPSPFPLNLQKNEGKKQEGGEGKDASASENGRENGSNQTNGTITHGEQATPSSSKDPFPQADHMDVDPSLEPQQAPVAAATTATATAPQMQPQILLSPSKKSTTMTQGAQHSTKNPFLRLSTSGTTRPPKERENGIHKRHSITTVTLRGLPQNNPQRFAGSVAVRPPPFVSATVNPYQLAMDAAPKVRPIVNIRQIEKKSGPQPVEVLNFSMLGNVGDLSSDRGVEWNEFVTKKRKGGRPPKRRDLPTAVGSESTLSLAEASSRSSKMEMQAAADEEAGGESQRDHDRKLSNWFEEMDDDNWSSEGSEESDSNNFNETIDQF